MANDLGGLAVIVPNGGKNASGKDQCFPLAEQKNSEKDENIDTTRHAGPDENHSCGEQGVNGSTSGFNGGVMSRGPCLGGGDGLLFGWDRHTAITAKEVSVSHQATVVQFATDDWWAPQ